MLHLFLRSQSQFCTSVSLFPIKVDVEGTQIKISMVKYSKPSHPNLMFSLLLTCLHSCVNLVPKPKTGEGKRFAFLFLVLLTYLANNMDVLCCAVLYRQLSANW